MNQCPIGSRTKIGEILSNQLAGSVWRPGAAWDACIDTYQAAVKVRRFKYLYLAFTLNLNAFRLFPCTLNVNWELLADLNINITYTNS